jgi:3-mercaptopyruvate sulfurtransferase SseA
MKGKLKLAAASALVAAAAIFGACKADDTAGTSHADSGASHAAAKPAASADAAKPAPSVVAQAPAEEARRVTVEEVKKMLDSGKAVIYDTRAKAAYDAEHVKGSLSLPFDQVAAHAGELPKDKTIVFYCT